MLCQKWRNKTVKSINIYAGHRYRARERSWVCTLCRERQSQPQMKTVPIQRPAFITLQNGPRRRKLFQILEIVVKERAVYGFTSSHRRRHCRWHGLSRLTRWDTQSSNFVSDISTSWISSRFTIRIDYWIWVMVMADWVVTSPTVIMYPLKSFYRLVMKLGSDLGYQGALKLRIVSLNASFKC